MSYVKQGEEALQKALSILSDQDGWTIETVAVSTETGPPSRIILIHSKIMAACHDVKFWWSRYIVSNSKEDK